MRKILRTTHHHPNQGKKGMRSGPMPLPNMYAYSWKLKCLTDFPFRLHQTPHFLLFPFLRLLIFNAFISVSSSICSAFLSLLICYAFLSLLILYVFHYLGYSWYYVLLAFIAEFYWLPFLILYNLYAFLPL